MKGHLCKSKTTNKGPNIEPCETPHVTYPKFVLALLIDTHYCLLLRYESIKLLASPRIL